LSATTRRGSRAPPRAGDRRRKGQAFGADDARVALPAGQPEHDDDRERTRTERGAEREREQELGEGQGDVRRAPRAHRRGALGGLEDEEEAARQQDEIAPGYTAAQDLEERTGGPHHPRDREQEADARAEGEDEAKPARENHVVDAEDGLHRGERSQRDEALGCKERIHGEHHAPPRYAPTSSSPTPSG
jgi:hypothetical protein